MPHGTTDVGRLALRGEGDYWNAYYARAGTMRGAVLLGSLHMAVAERHPERRAEFQALMQAVVDDVVAAVGGGRIEWGPMRPAPPGERGGNA